MFHVKHQPLHGANIPMGVIVAAQVVMAFTIAPVINMLFTLGEELGWRGYLLPKLLPLGQWNAILVSGVVWGGWHASAIAQGHNYPGYPVLGIFKSSCHLDIFFSKRHLFFQHEGHNTCAALPRSVQYR